MWWPWRRCPSRDGCPAEPPCSRPRVSSSPCRGPRGPGCLAPGHVHSGRVAGGTEPTAPAAPAQACAACWRSACPPRWAPPGAGGNASPLPLARHPLSPVVPTGPRACFLALSWCFWVTTQVSCTNGPAVSLLFWNLPAFTHCPPAHITWLLGAHTQHLQSCDAGRFPRVMMGTQAPPYPALCTGPGVGGLIRNALKQCVHLKSRTLKT